jgi:hypothetical protein
MLCTSERKILRRIYGPLQYTGHCRPRWYSEIYNLYKDLNIVDYIQIRRLGEAGHIILTEDERIPKRFLMGNFVVQHQWENQAQDGKTLSGGILIRIRGWRRRVEDREEWRRLPRDARAQKGL